MEQALTQLEVKILFDDSTYYDDEDDTEAGTMMDVVYEVDFCLIRLFTSHQQSFSYKATGLPAMNQY